MNDILREKVAGRLVDAPVVCRETGRPIATCDCGGNHCRACGCTDFAACAGPCTWIEPDLCSSCVPGRRPGDLYVSFPEDLA